LLKAIRPVLIIPPSFSEGDDAPALRPIAAPAFDAKALLEHFGGDRELLGELARIFLEDCPARLAAIQAGVERVDAGVLLDAAHALRGSVANFGAVQAVDAALKLELMGKARDLTGAPAALVRLQQAMAALMGELSSVTRLGS
jgi:two-component system, sensor histidine kinase and response regulator